MQSQVTNWLDAIVQAWSDWMCGMSLHVTWLVGLLWLTDRWLKRTSARLRFVLWSLVLLRLVVPPSLVLPTSVGWWCGDWFVQQASAWSLTQSDLASTHEITDVRAEALQPASAQAISVDWSSFIFMLWLGFAVAQLVWMLLGWRQIKRWLAQSTLLSDSCSQSTLARAMERVKIASTVELRDSGHCNTPLIIGCLRPIILLPTAVRESLSSAELESVLVHELTHLARRDSWWRLIQSVLGVVYFFHPAVWLAIYKLNQLCEEACDEQTVWALSGQRRDYAQAIVKSATLVGYQPPHMAMNMVGASLPVKRRLQRILDPALPWNSGGSSQRAVIVLLLALVLLPSGYRSTQATSPERMRQLGLPLVSDSSNDADISSRASSPDRVRDDELEQQALAQLKSTDYETRLLAYKTLEIVGSTKALQELEEAFLNRRGIEQDAAKRALDRVWSIIRLQSTEASQSTRIIQNYEER